MTQDRLRTVLNVVVPLALIAVSGYAIWDYTRVKSPRERVQIAYQRGEFEKALAHAGPLIDSDATIEDIQDAVIQSLLGLEKYLELAELICRGRLRSTDTDLLNRIGMQLQTGNRRMIDAGICCLEKAVALAPESRVLNYDLGLLYWNGGRPGKARRQCETVLTIDPGNIQAIQILERIAKGTQAAMLDQDRFQSRSVRFRINAPAGTLPHIAGSWDDRTGQYVALGGWQPEPMIDRTPADLHAEPADHVFELTKRLATDAVHWYQVVVRDGPDPTSPTRAFCRFPLYPTSETDITIELGEYPAFEPDGLLEDREAPRPPAPATPPTASRIYLLCVDSATFNVLIPLLQAGLTENIRRLMNQGSTMTLISRPPVSTIAFDILNFGTLRGFGLADVIKGGIGVLKERGVNLLTYGDIAGTDHTWKYLAGHGISTLYASWAEQLHYGPGGKETVHRLDLDPDEIALAGRVPRSDREKVAPMLWPEDRDSLLELSASDELVVSLYDQGVKKFYQGLELFDELNPRVTLVHVGFIDVSFHMFWDSMDSETLHMRTTGAPPSGSPPSAPPSEGLPPPDSRRYERVIAGLHRVLDLMVGDLLARLDLEHDTVMIFSDHGAVGGFAKSYYGHVPEAVLIAAGKGIRSGLILDGTADMVDLVPTVCRLLKTPPPPGYPGQAIEEILTE